MKRLPVRVQIAIVWVTLLALSLVAAPVMAGSRSVNVTVDQARDFMQQRAGQKDFIILDVRTPEEFADGHLSGAVNVNLLAPDFTARLGALNRGKTYLVYCQAGHRSTQAVQAMLRLRFRSVYNMVEGIVGWQNRGFPLSRTQ